VFCGCNLRKNKPKAPQNLHECRIQASFDFEILSGIRLIIVRIKLKKKTRCIYAKN
jgi:hypothetical protein